MFGGIRLARFSSSSTGVGSTSTPCRSEGREMELFRQTNIDFLKYKWWAIGASWALIAVGVFTIARGAEVRHRLRAARRSRSALPARHRQADAARRRGPRRSGSTRAPRRTRCWSASSSGRRGRRRQRSRSPCEACGAGGPDKIDINSGQGHAGRPHAAPIPTGSRALHGSERLLHSGRGRSRPMFDSGIFGSPEQAASTEGISQATRPAQANTVTGPFVALRRQRRARSERTSEGPAAVVWSTVGMPASSRSAFAPSSAWVPSWRSSTTL